MFSDIWYICAYNFYQHDWISDILLQVVWFPKPNYGCLDFSVGAVDYFLSSE